MPSLSLSTSVSIPLCTKNNLFVTPVAQFRLNCTINSNSNPRFHIARGCSSVASVIPNQFLFNPPRLSIIKQPSFFMEKNIKPRRAGVVCYAGAFTPMTLEWLYVIATVVLMLVKGTAVNKAFLVPLFALQAPAVVVAWIKGEYGVWSAFLALLVRLFFFIPGELELPLMTLLMVIAAPLQAISLRATPPGTIISLAIAGFLAFQHFSRAGSLQKAFEHGAIVATLAILFIALVPLLLLCWFYSY